MNEIDPNSDPDENFANELRAIPLAGCNHFVEATFYKAGWEASQQKASVALEPSWKRFWFASGLCVGVAASILIMFGMRELGNNPGQNELLATPSHINSVPTKDALLKSPSANDTNPSMGSDVQALAVASMQRDFGSSVQTHGLWNAIRQLSDVESLNRPIRSSSAGTHPGHLASADWHEAQVLQIHESPESTNQTTRDLQIAPTIGRHPSMQIRNYPSSSLLKRAGLL